MDLCYYIVPLLWAQLGPLWIALLRNETTKITHDFDRFVNAKQRIAGIRKTTTGIFVTIEHDKNKGKVQFES